MEEIKTTPAPRSSSPLSQGIDCGDTVYISGQVPKDPASSEVVSDDINVQTEKTLENLDAVLTSVDMTFENVVKTTVFLVDIETKSIVNEIYREKMPKPFPARSAVEVSALGPGIKIEIEAIARR